MRLTSKARRICFAAVAVVVASLVAGLTVFTWQRLSIIAQKRHTVRQLEVIAKAFLDYWDVHRRAPPTVVFTKEGKLLHSWRVMILPFIGEEKLYREFKLDEP